MPTPSSATTMSLALVALVLLSSRLTVLGHVLDTTLSRDDVAHIGPATRFDAPMRTGFIKVVTLKNFIELKEVDTMCMVLGGKVADMDEIATHVHLRKILYFQDVDEVMVQLNNSIGAYKYSNHLVHYPQDATVTKSKNILCDMSSQLRISCPKGFRLYRWSCFQVVLRSERFLASKCMEHCTNQHSQMVTIDDQSDNRVVSILGDIAFRNLPKDVQEKVVKRDLSNSIWSGMRLPARFEDPNMAAQMEYRKENLYRLDGSPNWFRNWAPEEPNGGVKGDKKNNERCVTIGRQGKYSGGLWNDYYCDRAKDEYVYGCGCRLPADRT